MLILSIKLGSDVKEHPIKPPKRLYKPFS